MPRLYRPYIPIAVRVQVAERQLVERGFWHEGHVAAMSGSAAPAGMRLRHALDLLFGKAPHELHHRPALVNRQRKRNGDYDPPANHPDYLVYLPADEHDIETRVRGLRGQHSDLGLARKRKRAERKKAAKKRVKYNRKYNWPSRPLRSRPFRRTP